jgi:hypothetical protein
MISLKSHGDFEGTSIAAGSVFRVIRSAGASGFEQHEEVKAWF